jgi:chromosomal replication initiation ATPase DnaA
MFTLSMDTPTPADPLALGLMQPIFDAVSRKYRIPESAIRGPGKIPMQLEARQVCCWLASKLTRLSPAEIGKTVGRGRTAYGQAVARIERERSTEPLVMELTDALLNQLRAELSQ